MDMLQVIEAKFMPRRTDDLIIGAEDWIGRKLEWQAIFIIESGTYENEWAMSPYGKHRFNTPFTWVPLGDLEIIE